MFNSYCYKYFETQKSWSDAKTYCQNLGSYLVTVHSQAENQFAFSLLPESRETRIWMGGNDVATNGVWIWEDGKPWGVYTAWISGEPNGGNSESCLEIVKTNRGWNDAPCSNTKPSVCKKGMINDCGIYIVLNFNLFRSS